MSALILFQCIEHVLVLSRFDNFWFGVLFGVSDWTRWAQLINHWHWHCFLLAGLAGHWSSHTVSLYRVWACWWSHHICDLDWALLGSDWGSITIVKARLNILYIHVLEWWLFCQWWSCRLIDKWNWGSFWTQASRSLPYSVHGHELHSELSLENILLSLVSDIWSVFELGCNNWTSFRIVHVVHSCLRSKNFWLLNVLMTILTIC